MSAAVYAGRPAVRGAAADVETPDEIAVRIARGRVAAAFAADGELAGAVGGFTARDSQRDLALAVFDAIAERGTLVAEAGTGTGKTFAYLVPALVAGGKVLISTGTKALQDQVFAKDLAAVRSALGLDIAVALLKGRQNYVCLHRLARTEAEGMLASRQDVQDLRAIVQFARNSDNGDRGSLPDVPETAPIWLQVTSTRDNCLGQECPRFAECFVMKARRDALAADVVVVNHHLFLADLALRDDAVRDFLPTADTVILDEAHQLPKIAAEFFGTGWSLAQLTDLVQDARAIGLARAADGAAWVALTQAIEAAARELRLVLAEAGLRPGQRMALDRVPGRPVVAQQLDRLVTALASLHQALEVNRDRDLELDALAPRTEALRAQVATWATALRVADVRDSEAQADAASAAAQDDDTVRWLALSQHGAQFQATPLAPGESFARVREQQPQAWILTSATLTVAQRFDAFLADIGLPEASTRRWDSPFDFAHQGLLYLPQPMPSPLAHDFPEQVAHAAWPVIEAARGRAFVLCSTLRAVDRVAAVLRRELDRAGLDLPLLVQGVRTRRALLEEFRRAGNAVLVGSVSFWEGIDVRGEALSLVVIDKLPFAPPDDPVVEARLKRLRTLGRNGFTEYQLPQAVTLLKQGAGRLIRDERDRGVLMLCDDRLLTKSYGRTVLGSLPPFARTRSLDEACDFFRDA
ncbi:MAG: ATP-dependent DNA helicase [Burkholderiaceae bacterium]|nr:ATP-dependent DNA helicase [Burkholderiaceae bacterium]